MNDLNEFADQLVGVTDELKQEIRALAAKLPEKPLTAATRLQFEAMTPSDRLAFIRRGGKIADGEYNGTRR